MAAPIEINFLKNVSLNKEMSNFKEEARGNSFC